MSKSAQKVVKKLSKSCQKVVKVVKKLYKFKTSGEDHDDDEEEEEEEDWGLQDQVATSSHLVKTTLTNQSVAVRTSAFWFLRNLRMRSSLLPSHR
jgi:hypothetical protein